MKRAYKLILLLIIVVIVRICFSVFFLGTTKTFSIKTPEGQVKIVAKKDRNGNQTIAYHPNGKVSSIVSYGDHRAEGPYKFYDKEGRLVKEGIDPDGYHREYDQQGNVSLEYNLKNYKCDGVSREYRNGKLLRESTCDFLNSNVAEAIRRAYHPNGQLIIEEHYIHGKANG